MSNHVVPAFARTVILKKSRGLGGVFRKVFLKNQLIQCQTENVSSLAKRFFVISKCGGASKKTEMFMNLSQVLQRSKNLLNFLCFHSTKSLFSSTVSARKYISKIVNSVHFYNYLNLM